MENFFAASIGANRLWIRVSFHVADVGWIREFTVKFESPSIGGETIYEFCGSWSQGLVQIFILCPSLNLLLMSSLTKACEVWIICQI